MEKEPFYKQDRMIEQMTISFKMAILCHLSNFQLRHDHKFLITLLFIFKYNH